MEKAVNKEKNRLRAAVVGGVNTDIIGRPGGPLLLHDSNIASVSLGFGGVGRNMAQNLAQMGFETLLFAALGEDGFARTQLLDMERAGIDPSHCVCVPGARTGVYLCINDQAGDMYVALNDMAVCEALTPDRVDMAAINACDVCLLDANLSRETLHFIAEEAAVPLVADPVSVAKAGRLKGILPRLAALKPNALEAEALTGESDPALAAKKLVGLGVKRVFVSLGAKGMAYEDEFGGGWVPACFVPEKNILSTTGAGDAATAAIGAGWALGLATADMAGLASRAAALTIQSPGAVSESIDTEFIQHILKGGRK